MHQPQRVLPSEGPMYFSFIGNGESVFFFLSGVDKAYYFTTQNIKSAQIKAVAAKAIAD